MGGSSGSQTTTTTAQIPSFLNPLMNQSADVAGQALGNLSGGQNQNQIQGQQAALDIAGGAGGFIPQSQNVLSAAARGDVVNQNTGSLIDSFQAMMQGRQFDPSTQQAMQAAANAEGAPQASFDTLEQFATTPFQLNQTTQDTLEQTAGGDFLYGGQGFNEAVQASINQARPNILSSFAQGGSGAARGGLAQEATQRAASDAFARLFSQERSNQLGAANQLGGFQLQGNQQQLGAAGNLGSLGINQLNAFTNRAGTLGGLDLQQRQQQLAATQGLGGLLDAERGRQLNAAQALPQAGLLPSEIQRGVGNEQMGMDQDLLTAALAGLPMGSLIGQQSTQPIHRNRAGGALGGALAGAKLGSIVPGLGTGIGAIGGGLLGGLF